MFSCDHINLGTTKMSSDKLSYFKETEPLTFRDPKEHQFLLHNLICVYLNSLSMVSENVDSNNSFVKLWIRRLDDVII